MDGTKKWPDKVFLGVGIANIAFSLIWLFNLVSNFVAFKVKYSHAALPPDTTEMVEIGVVVNLLLLLVLAATGVGLIRTKGRAVVYCSLFFILEIIYPVLAALVCLVNSYVLMGIVSPMNYEQRRIFYPFIALVLINVAKHYSSKDAAETSPAMQE